MLSVSNLGYGPDTSTTIHVGPGTKLKTSVLGLPWDVTLTTSNEVYGNPYSGSGLVAVWSAMGDPGKRVAKAAVPQALAKAIDREIAKGAVRVLAAHPEYASDPGLLLAEAKRNVHLLSEGGATVAVVSEVGGSPLGLSRGQTQATYRAVYPVNVRVNEFSDHYQVRIYKHGGGLQDFPLVRAAMWTAETVVPYTGLEWVLKQLSKLACKAVADDRAKLVAAAAVAYYSGGTGLAAYQGAVATLASVCGHSLPPPPLPSPGEPPGRPGKATASLATSPWYKRGSTYAIAGTAAISVGAGLGLVRFLRR